MCGFFWPSCVWPLNPRGPTTTTSSHKGPAALALVLLPVVDPCTAFALSARALPAGFFTGASTGEQQRSQETVKTMPSGEYDDNIKAPTYAGSTPEQRKGLTKWLNLMTGQLELTTKCEEQH